MVELIAKLESLELGGSDMVVLDLISKVTDMETDDDGLPSPAFRAGNDRYHISGLLTTAPPTSIKKHLGCCAGMIDLLAASKMMLICPIPRHVEGERCEDPTIL